MKKQKEHLFDPLTTVEEQEEEIIVKWVNKYGIPMDVKTRKGGLIHALWLAEHEKRSKKRISEEDNTIDIQPEIIACQQPKGVSPDNICQKQLQQGDQPSP